MVTAALFPSEPRLLSFTLFALLAFLALVYADEIPECTVAVPGSTSEFYDLRPLTKDTEDWKVLGLEGGNREFYINICHAVITGSIQSAGAFYKDTDGIVNIGAPSKSPKLVGSALTLKYTDGGTCPDTNSKKNRETVVSFVCDKNAGLGSPQYIGDVLDCGYFIEWKTAQACSSVSLKSGGSVFVTILSVGATVYLFGGILYNRIKHNARGVEQIPHWSFWKRIFDFIKDIFIIIFARCLPQRRPAVYRGLARDEENGLIDEDFEEH